MQDVFNAPAVSLAAIHVEIGEQKLQAMMVKWMNGFLRFYSTNGAMDALQVADTINLIIDVYPHYTIYDFKFFFKLAKLASFGEVFGRMDGSVILSWLRKYDIMRDTAAMDASIKESEKYKERGKKLAVKGMFYQEYLKWKENHKQQ